MTKVYDSECNEVEDIQLPPLFSTPYRPDVIKRAVLSERSAKRQPYGADPLSGKRTSAHYHGKRKYRWAMMNKEMSRMPRIHGKVGSLHFTARFAPQAVKGRQAHPPKAEKIWLEKVNNKERSLAIRSALAAAASLDIVTGRGHKTQISPIIFTGGMEDIGKTKDVLKILAKLIPNELERCAVKKVRAGKGKMRGRQYRKKKGPLVIVSKECSLSRAARNITGVDVSTAGSMTVEALAPGTHAGRLMIITKPAIQKIDEIYGETA
ncbi:MAG: 50S ribosomal protein L4 [Candidatus Aenigmarchaeota archaeon]|nr:50S ribosomal protein L4 [Candidatus Aenigmarchaeota archaeon]